MDKEKLKWLMGAALCCAVLMSWVGAQAQETGGATGGVTGGATGGMTEDAAGTTTKLRLLETTDIHTNIVPYDYYRDEPTDEFGLAKTATLIKAAKGEINNVLLFDNGDLIQGSPLGDFKARTEPLKEGEVHPVYKAMNLLDYDAGNIGNHEFNYGLKFLDLSLEGANFPYVNANVYVDDGDDNPDNDENRYTPYLILDKTVTDESGAEHELQVGVIGFVPPQIMEWDRSHLLGEVVAKDIVETAEKFVPQMLEEGADLVVAIPHSGFGPTEQQGMEENASYLLSRVEGVDAILFGHSHTVFPSEAFSDEPNVDLEKGTINGVPAVMPGFWGDHLGVIDLTLEVSDDEWTVVDSQVEARPIYDSENDAPLVEADQEILDAVAQEHEGTLTYVRGSVAQTSAPITSYFALVKDDPSVQIVNQAQTWYTERAVQGTELEGLPVLSAAAPFKAGGRAGPNYYTDIAEGTLAVKNVADLYIYPNTLKVVRLNGDQVKEWLEMSAGQFNQIAPDATDQSLLNEDFPSYNFDVIDGVTYEIDVTQPPRYDAEGLLVNEDGGRIVNLQYNGEPVTADQEFLVATNNYRASGGGNFPNLDGTTIVIDSPDENRQVIINYLTEQETVNPSADENWEFAPVEKEVSATFPGGPDAQKYLEEVQSDDETIEYVGAAEDGFALYELTLKPSSAQ